MPYTAGPYDSAHLYLQWGGKLPGGEQWSCGLRLRKKTAGAAVAADAAGLLVGAAAAVVAYHQSANINISANAKLSSVKLNTIGTDGHYMDSSTNEAIYSDLPGAGSATPVYPNQVALAVSLLTGFSRGPAHRGRFYLPIPSLGLDINGTIAAANADAVSDATDTFISSLNSLGSPADYEVAVFSRKLGAAGNRKVTGNEVGRVFDTQRRRRRSLVENYQ